MKRLLALAAFFSLTAFASAEPLKVGDAAPQVTATTEAGTQLKFADVYSKNPYTLVFFYPKAFTGGCTAQSCSLRDGYEALTKKGVAIIGVSVDTVEKQKAFKDEYKLPYTLISDTDHKVIQAFGQAEDRKTAARQAYLIKDGKVIYADTKGSTKSQSDDILNFLAAPATK